nr:transposase, mutator type [Tanacetum cinerariifolium]
MTRTFRRVYVCLGALKQGFRACGTKILGLNGCFMSGPWPGQILTAVGVDANNEIDPVAYAIVKAESKASWHIHENMMSQFKRDLYKEMLWNAAKANFVGKFNKKMAELKSFNSVAYDWLMKIPVEQWSIAYFQRVLDEEDCSSSESDRKWELTGIPCKHVVAAIYNMSKNLVGVAIPEQWVHTAYRLETWAHVYSFKVNPCNGREMWLEVEVTTVIVPLYKPQVGRTPKKRNKSHDEIANESCSLGKFSEKGKSVRCGKCGNMGHNRKACRGQGGATQAGGSSARNVSGQGGARRTAGARNVFGQASARQVVGARIVSGQTGGTSNVSSQSVGSSQPIAEQSTSTGAMNASSQPSSAPSTASQGPTQYNVKERQEKDKIETKPDKKGSVEKPDRAARRWIEKELPRLITNWDDLISKFINEFFPPSRTTNLRNEILNFQQKFDESFHEAWERYKDLLCACPHHGFTELHQLDTFYNALNPADQDSLNATAGGNLFEKSPQDALTIIENKSKVCNSRSKPIASPVNACDNHSSSELAKLTHAVNQQTNSNQRFSALSLHIEEKSSMTRNPTPFSTVCGVISIFHYNVLFS